MDEEPFTQARGSVRLLRMTTDSLRSRTEIPSVAIVSLPDNAVMLDVREDSEWARGHAPGAVHISLGQLDRRVDELPAGRPVVVASRRGGRSVRAVSFLRHQGYDVVNLEGGMMAWTTSNRPLRHAGLGAPTVE